MKINRLLEITIILLNRKTITAGELADRFGVSVRTIYRDLDVLSSAGVPVYTSKGNGGGISLLEDYSLNRALISRQESESLLLALKTLQATKYPEVETILDKLAGMFKSTVVSDWVEIDLSPWGSNPDEYNKFSDIKKAILKRLVLTFNYISSTGRKSSRSIEPMKLIYKGQAWYLWGFCKVRNNFRTLRISRIKNLLVSNETFERRKQEASLVDSPLKEPIPLVYLRLKFRPEILYRVYDDFDSEMIEKNHDDTCEVSVAFPEDEWIYGYILSFGNYVEVLEPEHVKINVIERIKKTLKQYQKSLPT